MARNGHKVLTQSIPLAGDEGADDLKTRERIAHEVGNLLRRFARKFHCEWEVVSTTVTPVYDAKFQLSLIVVLIAREVLVRCEHDAEEPS